MLKVATLRAGPIRSTGWTVTGPGRPNQSIAAPFEGLVPGSSRKSGASFKACRSDRTKHPALQTSDALSQEQDALASFFFFFFFFFVFFFFFSFGVWGGVLLFFTTFFWGGGGGVFFFFFLGWGQGWGFFFFFWGAFSGLCFFGGWGGFFFFFGAESEGGRESSLLDALER